VLGAPVVAPLLRSIATFRFASVGYAAILLVVRRVNYTHWGWAWVVLAGMFAWTVVSLIAYSRPAWRTRALLAADLLVTAIAVLSTALVQSRHAINSGAMPVTATWLAGPTLAWAVTGGARAGAIAAVVISGCTIALRHPLTRVIPNTDLDGPVIMLMAAMLVGYVTTLAIRGEQAIQRATEIEAASRERERLARMIHDSVLQVLAMVQRRGAGVGGAAAEIGRLAGEQEAALRALITADGHLALPAGELDLSAQLMPLTSAVVSVITPAEPVLLPERTAREMTAAVREAIDNVRRHCGESARAWVLVDDEGTVVSVTIRDDGPGVPAGRLAEAAAEGRLGVSHAIRGRVRELGGSADISSAPGTGTEVRLRVPRAEGREPE
jgi:signal transduction histidine kinase